MTEDIKPKDSEMFAEGDDPNPNYVLTMDNAKKILAIHQRLRYYQQFVDTLPRHSIKCAVDRNLNLKSI